jgi:hypothetical protein
MRPPTRILPESFKNGAEYECGTISPLLTVAMAVGDQVDAQREKPEYKIKIALERRAFVKIRDVKLYFDGEPRHDEKTYPIVGHSSRFSKP